MNEPEERDVSNESMLDWQQLFGFDQDLQRFKKLLTESRLSQVILFEGRAGIGKRLFLAKCLGLIFCEQREACGRCSSCMEIKQQAQSEVLWLEAEKTFKVEDAETLQEHLALKSSGLFAGQSHAARVGVLVDIEKLGLAAANRLLKTLEEPESNTFVFLTSSHSGQIMDTILSRAMRWSLRPPPREESFQWLRGQFSLEEHSDADIRVALERSGLSPGVSLSKLTEGLEEDRQSLDLLFEQLLLAGSPSELFRISQQLAKERRISVNDLANQLELILNQIYKHELGVSSSEQDLLVTSSQGQRAALPSQSEVFFARRRVLKNLRRLAIHKKIPVNVQLATEAVGIPNLT